MAINNPYVPGDPFSYDLKWMVQEVKKAQAVGEAAAGSAEAAAASAEAASDSAYNAATYANNALQFSQNAEASAENAADSAENAAGVVAPITQALNTQGQKISVLEGRMDAFTQLAEGSTTGDAELMDIRVAVDGEVYPTAGDAVRAQVNAIGEFEFSTNILNQDGTEITGKYLNPNSGAVNSNAAYFYIDEYFPIEADTIYTPSQTNKTTGVQVVGIQTFLIFYDAQKNYISGLENQNAFFTTPNNAAYFRWSASLTQKATYNFQIEKGMTLHPYVPYFKNFVVKHPLSRLIIVDANGNGDYTTVTSAVERALTGDLIFVRNGIYDNEEVAAWGKTLSIIGESKNGVVIQNGLNTYSRPPMEFSAGVLKNLTIKAYDGGGASLDANGWKSYAVHLDNSHSANKHILIENCNITSEISAGIGIGLWANETVEFTNCDFVGVSNKGGMYCHDNANAGNAGPGKLICHNCTFSNTLPTKFGLNLESYNMANTSITAEFINCSANPRPVFVTTGGEVTRISLLEHWTVSPLAFGNKYTTLEQ